MIHIMGVAPSLRRDGRTGASCVHHLGELNRSDAHGYIAVVFFDRGGHRRSSSGRVQSVFRV